VWSTVPLPVAPWAQVHHRLDVEHRGVEIVRKPLVHTAHRIRVRRIAWLPIRRATRIPLGERLDVGLLARCAASLQRHRFLHQLVRLRLLVRLHQGVDIRTQHQRLTPVGHRQLGIEPRGFSKRTTGLRVVERVSEIEALIHERLRVAIARRDRECV
jgi:hypothetical protein